MRILALAPVLLIVAVGCGSSTYLVAEKPEVPLQRYSAVYLKDMQTDAWLQNIPERARPKWKHVLTHAPLLFKQSAEAKLSGDFRVLPQPEEGCLIVESELSQFIPGSRFGRMVLGIFGVGTARMEVLCTLVDYEDMAPIGSGKAIGTVRYSLFGGSAVTTYSRSGKGLGKFLIDHR